MEHRSSWLEGKNHERRDQQQTIKLVSAVVTTAVLMSWSLGSKKEKIVTNYSTN